MKKEGRKEGGRKEGRDGGGRKEGSKEGRREGGREGEMGPEVKAQCTAWPGVSAQGVSLWSQLLRLKVIRAITQLLLTQRS